MRTPLLLVASLLPACLLPTAGDEVAADPWDACACGWEGRVAEADADLLVTDVDGTSVMFAYGQYGASWLALDADLGGATLLGAAPLVGFGGYDLLGVRVDDAGRLAVATESHLRVVTDGFTESIDYPWAFPDGQEESWAFRVRNAWVVDGRTYVAYTWRLDELTWTAGIGVADDIGRVTPLVDPVVELPDRYLGDARGVGLDGGWDPATRTFLLSTDRMAGTTWRVGLDGTVTTAEGGATSRLPQWAPLGDGRWTAALRGTVEVFEPAVADSAVKLDSDALAEPFDSGSAFALADGRVVVAGHTDGVLSVQAWNGDDPAAGPALAQPFTFDVCNPWVNGPPAELAR